MAETTGVQDQSFWVDLPPPQYQMNVGEGQSHLPVYVSVRADGTQVPMYHLAPAPNSNARLSKPQHRFLEQEFRRHQKPTTAYKKDLALMLNVAPDKINNWFQNRRAKQKQKDKNGESEEEALFTNSEPSINGESEVQSYNASPERSLSLNHWGQPATNSHQLATSYINTSGRFHAPVQLYGQQNNSIPILRSDSMPELPFTVQDGRVQPAYLQQTGPKFFTNHSHLAVQDQHVLPSTNVSNAEQSITGESFDSSQQSRSMSQSSSSDTMDVKPSAFDLVEQNGSGQANRPRGMMGGNRRRAPPALQLNLNSNSRSASFSNALPTSPLAMPSPGEIRRSSSAVVLNNRIHKPRGLQSGQRSPAYAQIELAKKWAATQAQGIGHTLHPPPTPLTPYEHNYMLSSTAEQFPEMATPVSSASESFGSMNAPLGVGSTSYQRHVPVTSPPITPQASLVFRSGHLNASYFTPPQSAPANQTSFGSVHGESALPGTSYLNNEVTDRRPSVTFNQFNDELGTTRMGSMADMPSMDPAVTNMLIQSLNATANGVNSNTCHQPEWFDMAPTTSLSAESLQIHETTPAMIMSNDNLGYMSDMSESTLLSRTGSLVDSTITTPNSGIELVEQIATSTSSSMDSTQFIQFDPNAIRAEQASRSKNQKLSDELRFVNSHPSNYNVSR